ncbi:MAG: alanine--tRNA ligase [Bauldia sp.]|nr:alanine--tRNA ligase [Bauldia sp.]
MQTVNEIRSHFLGFFEREGHVAVPSSPLVPRNDPTLLFTNAGMVQFKDYFTGRSLPLMKRAATAQKCVRAGGKHNDLDNVGYTARHHTFFEMLGNFSFGDYFKDVAIELAWNLLTREFGLPKDRLLATVYIDDDEAAVLWKKIAGLPDDRIIRIAGSDNFWMMGETGPCGPCSEIFYDHGPKVSGGPPGSADQDGDRFIEVWNLVFMQYEQLGPGNRVPLPKPSIDTGMGLERIAAVLQGVHDNYDIDLFRKLIGASVQLTGVPAEGEARASHRVIADHLRSSCFLIADGVLPSNEGRGYVLRRIMRRGMRHAHLLGAKEPLMWRLVPVLTHEMGDAYPELRRAEALIAETLRLEETRFRRTLASGLGRLDEATAGLASGDELPGETAFKLYDTYGFPLDLTQDALKSRGIGVDLAGFNAAMEKQKADARASWVGSGEAQTEPVWYRLRERHGATEFLGYETLEADGQILAIVAKGEEISEARRKGDEIAVVVNQTPFYAESGGQVGDNGTMTTEAGGRFVVTDVTKRADGLFVHTGILEEGHLLPGEVVHMAVDRGRRGAIQANHSATHLLHAALRDILGKHVAQKGSLVSPDRLRFDFSHPKPMTEEEIGRVASLANEVVLEDAEVTTRLMDRESAMSSGAMALFGEKYGEEVRVVSMGAPEPTSPEKPFSVELCGGTHVHRTGEIGLVTVVGESAVAAGVRRIEALTGRAAREHLEAQEKRLRSIAGALKVRPDEAADRVAALVEERRRLEKELADARRELALGGGVRSEGDGVREVGSVKFLGREIKGIPAKDLKGIVDDGKKTVGSGVVAVVGVSDDGKAGIVVGVTDDLTGRFNAVDLVRRGSDVLGGKGGGGRPDMAQAGGPDGSKAGAALAAIEEALRASA